MRKTRTSKIRPVDKNDLLPEYTINYRKARPNRFAARFSKDAVAVVLGPDIARVFTPHKSVNATLRALITATPHRAR